MELFKQCWANFFSNRKTEFGRLIVWLNLSISLILCATFQASKNRLNAFLNPPSNTVNIIDFFVRFAVCCKPSERIAIAQKLFGWNWPEKYGRILNRLRKKERRIFRTSCLLRLILVKDIGLGIVIYAMHVSSIVETSKNATAFRVFLSFDSFSITMHLNVNAFGNVASVYAKGDCLSYSSDFFFPLDRSSSRVIVIFNVCYNFRPCYAYVHEAMAANVI